MTVMVNKMYNRMRHQMTQLMHQHKVQQVKVLQTTHRIQIQQAIQIHQIG